MGLLASNRSRLIAALILAALAAVVGLLLNEPGRHLGEAFLHNSYDSLHSLRGTRLDAMGDSPVVIVYLDLHSFDAEKQDPSLPWPRDLHAKLLRRLTKAGARAVVFDIVFSQNGPSTDA